MTYQFSCGCGDTHGDCSICEATKEIERISNENKELREFLKNYLEAQGSDPIDWDATSEFVQSEHTPEEQK